METINKKIEELKDILKDFPADVNTYILLTTLREIIAPLHAKLSMADDDQSRTVDRQIKMIADISEAIIELINVKEVKIKN